MPFFLVTHTSLVEADNEAAAAQSAVDKLRSGCPVSVAVKCDEVTSKVVAIPAMPPAAVSDATTAATMTDVMSPAVMMETDASADETFTVMASHKPGRLLTLWQVMALSIVAAIAIWVLV